jgi:hypothetical protein
MANDGWVASTRMAIHIEELFERAKQCFALALVSSDVDVKQTFEQIGDQLLNEAHELSDRIEGSSF